jgi:hypothetical protein
MAVFLYSSRNGYPLLIRYLQLTVLLLSLAGTFWYDLFVSGSVSSSPTILLLSPQLSLKTIFQILTSPFLLLYPGTSLTFFFDLVVLNALVTPIYTFVLSYLGTKNFIELLSGLILTGIVSFFLFSPLFSLIPCSLFSSLTLSIIVFWCMLHSKGQSFFLLAFPISPLLYLSVAAGATFYPILTNGEWAKLMATLVMIAVVYFIAILGFHLRSNIPPLRSFEDFVDRMGKKFRK